MFSSLSVGKLNFIGYISPGNTRVIWNDSGKSSDGVYAKDGKLVLSKGSSNLMLNMAIPTEELQLGPVKTKISWEGATISITPPVMPVVPVNKSPVMFDSQAYTNFTLVVNRLSSGIAPLDFDLSVPYSYNSIPVTLAVYNML